MHDRRHLGASPGSGGGGGGGGEGGGSGSGGRSVGAQARRRRRMSAPTPTGTRLIPRFNAAGGEGGSSGGASSSSSSSSPGGLNLGPHHRYSRHRVYPEASLTAKMGRLLFLGSSMGPSATEDEVLVMDGVLLANGSATPAARSTPFTDLGFGSAGSPGSGGGGGGYGPNRQFGHGRENALHLNPISFAPGAYIPPRPHPLPPPTLPGTPRGPAAIATRPPAPAHHTPARATATPATAPTGSSSSPAAARPAGTAFAWPPTEEEDAFISRSLYGCTPARRLPVFRSICPE